MLGSAPARNGFDQLDALQILKLAEVVAGIREGDRRFHIGELPRREEAAGLLISAMIFTRVGWSIARISFGSIAIAAIDPRFCFFFPWSSATEASFNALRIYE
jgi:hypothetical protein